MQAFFSVAFATFMMLLLIVAADAKCVKGKRTLDNVTKHECSVIRGTWHGTDVRFWDRVKKRVVRPQQ